MIIELAITELIDSLSALRGFVSLVSPILKEKEQKAVQADPKSFIPLLLAIYQSAEPSDTELLARFKESLPHIDFDSLASIESLKLASDGLREYVLLRHQNEILYRHSVVNLACIAEWFLARLLHYFFELHPEVMGIVDKCFSLSDLESFGSISDARQRLISLKVEELMRDSFQEWMKYFREKLKLKLDFMESDMEDIVELFQRRNVIVHNAGLVNHVYLAKVSKKHSEALKKGDRIIITPEYLERAICLMEKNLILLAAELWLKLDKDSQRRKDLIHDIMFDNLKAGRYEITEGLCQFMLRDKTMNESDKLIAQVNIWLCHKFRGTFDKVGEEVRKSDFSAKENIYKLARLALLDEFEAVFELLPRLLRNSELQCHSLRTWPLFHWVRQHPYYEVMVNKLVDEYPSLVPSIASGSENADVAEQIITVLDTTRNATAFVALLEIIRQRPSTV